MKNFVPWMTRLSLLLVISLLIPAAHAQTSALDTSGFETDRMYLALLRIFGQVVDQNTPETAFEGAIKTYAGFHLTAAGAWMGYLMIVGLVNSARDEEAFGKSWNGTWGSVRVLASFGMLAPVVGGGFPAVIAGVLLVARLAIVGGNEVSNSGVTILADYVRPVSAGAGGESLLFAERLLQVQTCIETNNAFHSARRWSGPMMDFERVEAGREYIKFRSSQTNYAPAGMCGSVTIDFRDLVRQTSNNGENQAVLDSVRRVHFDAVFGTGLQGDVGPGLMKRLEGPAKQLAYRAVNIYANDQTEVAPLDEVEASEIMRDIWAYDRSQIATISSYKDGLGDVMRQKFKEDAREVGWSGLNRFWMTISRINARSLSVLRYKPYVEQPNLQLIQRQFANEPGVVTAYTRSFAGANTYFYKRVANNQDIPNSTLTSNAIIETATLGPDALSTTIWDKVSKGIRSIVSLNVNQDTLTNFDDISFATVRENAPSATVPGSLTLPQDNFTNEDLGEGAVDPIGRLTTVGHNFIVLGETAIAAVLGAKVILATTDAIARKGTLFTDAVGIGALAAGATGGAVKALDLISDRVTAVALILIIVGVYYAFIIPFQVWLHYFIGVFGWLILVIEAVIAAPLWMIIHLNFKGDEFIDHRMVPGWLIILAIIAKPALMVLGFFASIGTFVVISTFIDSDFYAFFYETSQGTVRGIITYITMIILQAAAYLAATKLSFRLMTTIPDNIIARWMGGPSLSQQEESDTASIVGAVGAVKGLDAVGALRPSQRQGRPKTNQKGDTTIRGGD